MWSRRQAGVIDTRLVYRLYAVVVGLTGVVVVGWGPVWLGADLAGHPFARAALVRIFGSILIACGCFAVALAQVEDPLSRQRGMVWFAGGHGVMLLIVALQRQAIPGFDHSRIVWAAVALLSIATLLFWYLWMTAGGDPPPGPIRASFFGIMFRGGTSSSPTETLRSRYEQQIRQAASQEERNRMARELHDSIKQQLFVIQTAAATVQARFDEDPAGAREALDQVRSSARDAMTEMEVMLDQLRAAPLENTGLVEALKKQCEALGFRTGAHVEFKLGNLPWSGSLAPGAHEAILRAAQEVLSNVARHARAKNVDVSLDSAAGRFSLRVRDNGAGFDVNEGTCGMGIGNLRARAKEFGGEFQLASCLGWGTSVEFSIPYVIGAPGIYRRWVLICAIVLMFEILWFVFHGKSPFVLGLCVLIVIAGTRHAIAWRRARKQSEAAK